MATKLFIPGPTEVAPEVLAAMSGPMMGHRSKAASALQRRISNNLRRILLTEAIAKNLLLTTNLSIEEIMDKSGFINRGTFYKIFSQKYNMPPRQYREQQKEEFKEVSKHK